jgi:MoxR-like ATPase
MPLVRVNCHREQQSTDFLGKDILKADPSGATILEYDWSMTTLAAKHGSLLLIDEAFRSPALMSIQSLLERGGTLTLPDAASLTPAQRRIVPPADKLLIALTDNTNGTGDESGAYNAEVQDLSTLDRITSTIYVDFMRAEVEQQILADMVPPAVPAAIIGRVVDWANKMRDAFKRGAVQQPVSIRATSAILRKYAATGDLPAAVILTYGNKLSQSDRVVCNEAWHQVTGEDLSS